MMEYVAARQSENVWCTPCFYDAFHLCAYRYPRVQEEASSLSVLQCIWQATWLLQEDHAHQGVQGSASTPKGELKLARHDNSSDIAPLSSPLFNGHDEASFIKVKNSIRAICEFDGFMQCMITSGFDPQKLVLKIPRRSPRLMIPNDIPSLL